MAVKLDENGTVTHEFVLLKVVFIRIFSLLFDWPKMIWILLLFVAMIAAENKMTEISLRDTENSNNNTNAAESDNEWVFFVQFFIKFTLWITMIQCSGVTGS